MKRKLANQFECAYTLKEKKGEKKKNTHKHIKEQ